ncbi:MAG: ribonuclease PH [Streptococcaceae bacterium]|jgi:ribonuclease PH/non-canonical purine NTP pyrophosphatase (RdgB/HAM1 family)|nr:ribonuclease PH [Streptococcaceae bacterium]
MKRSEGRTIEQLRKVEIEIDVNRYAEGSCMISYGGTKVLCTASLESRVPPFLVGSDKGWVTAEYNLLPRATHTRIRRERGKVKGRTHEIERLIGRSLRAIIDLEKLGERSIIVDCDVLQADGGTRTASITGGYIALRLCIETLLQRGELRENPLIDSVAAVSVGINSEGVAILDLDYEEDSTAKVDMNIVRTGTGQFVEIQGTGEEATFSGSELNEMLALASSGIETLIHLQQKALEKAERVVETSRTSEFKEILIATRNVGKAKEFETLFKDFGIQVKTLLDYPNLPEVRETGNTFEENARLKAETISKLTGIPVLADDSGLMVDALGGMPGIFSARYSEIPGLKTANDASNNAKLLGDLHSAFVRGDKVSAKFHCTLVFARPEKESLVVEAEWPGEIIPIPRGANGFGYDPIFLVDGLGKTSAELSDEEKNTMSHRAKAMEKLSVLWKDWLEG